MNCLLKELTTFVLTLSLGLSFGLAPVALLAQDTVQGEAVMQNKADTLSRLLEVPEIKAAFEEGGTTSCKAESESGSTDAGECIWNKLGNGAPEGELSPLQEQALAIIQGPRSSGRDPSSSSPRSGEAPRFERNNVANIREHSVDPALKAVEDHLHEKLREAMYGEMRSQAEGNKVRVVDHGVFTQLFESRVSKNIIEAVTSFCIELSGDASSTKVWEIPTNADALKTNRENRLARIHAGATGSRDNPASADWSACATHTKTACTHVAAADSTTCPAITPNRPAGSDPSAPPPASVEAPHCSKDEPTRQRACRVQEAMEKARQQLLYLAAVKEGYRNLGMDIDTGVAGPNTNVNVLANAVRHCTRNDDAGRCVASEEIEVSTYSGRSGDGEKTIEDVTTITSGEIASAYDESAKATKTLLDECRQLGAGAKSDPRCQQFFMNEEEAKAAKAELAEFSLRGRVIEGDLEKMKKNFNGGDVDAGKAALTKYLQEEGRTAEQIETIVNGNVDTIKAVVDDINANYEAQRKAIVSSINSRIDKFTMTESLNETQVTEKINNVVAELSNRPDEYKQVLHFSNIVSGLLGSTTVGSNETTQNIGALRREINNLGTGAGTGIRERGDLDSRFAQQLSQGGDEATSTGIKAEQITGSLLEHNGLRQDNNSRNPSGSDGTGVAAPPPSVP